MLLLGFVLLGCMILLAFAGIPQYSLQAISYEFLLMQDTQTNVF